MSLARLLARTSVLLPALAVSCAVSNAATIVREKQPSAVIFLAQQCTEHERFAAQELRSVVSQIAGAELPSESISGGELDLFLKSTRLKNQIPIVLGSLADNHVPLKTPLARGAFVLNVSDNAIFIHGSGEGVRYAVSELLEQQGVRWFAPGDLFTIIPSLPSIHVSNQSLRQEPSFSSRWFQMPDKDWQVRVRCGGDSFPSAHGLPVPRASFDKDTGRITPVENAELFSLVAGVRTLRQHCISNPRLLDLVVESIRKTRANGGGPVVGMGPNDGRGFCECENCKKLDGNDFDPFSNEPSMTDRYIWFFNQVLERVTPEYPDTRIAFYIYHSYMRPPVRWKPHPQIMGALAPIGLDRVHGFSNPLSPERRYAHWLYSTWCGLLPEIYDRGYWSNLACPGFPFPIVHRLRDEIPACKAMGLRGWRVETFPNYASQLPSLYIAAKLMWNHQSDVDALLQDFHARCFGPAAVPMARYSSLMDNALRDSDHCTGSAWDMPFFYPAATRTAAKAELDRAADLATESPYRERVATITRTFRLLEEFIHMMEARNICDFPAAAESLKRMDAQALELMETKPVPMLSAGRFSTYVNYMRRFFRPATEEGFKRVSGENRLVAAAKDVWDFQIDPLRLGETLGWWRPEMRGGNWQQIRSSSSSWSNQGLRYYKGLAWYRQTISVPAEFKGKRIFLWCGGVDEKAKVWLNGTPIGISHGAAFYPFELDATPSVRTGENVVTICVVNDVVNEIGTGGVVAPLFLYAPANGPNARIDNGKFELKDTFP